jgi:hypothetical protein
MSPHRRRKRVAAGVGVAAALVAPLAAFGGSRVWIEPTAMSPAALGRGYDVATGELAGTCFLTVAATAPSVDFRYELDAADNALSRSGPATPGKGPPRHALRLVLSFRSYDRSLDEARSELAPEALALVRRGDLVAFFDACGTSYVRALTREARFDSTLAYQSPNGARDPRFEQELDAWLKSWTPGRDGAVPRDRSFAHRATGNRLSITSVADGLGAYAGGQLVAADALGLRAAAEAVFRAMRDDDAGRVVELEAARWSTHPAFVTALADADAVLRAGARDLRPSAIRRRILLDNSELLFALERAALPAPDVEACITALRAPGGLVRRSYRDVTSCRGLGEERAP